MLSLGPFSFREVIPSSISLLLIMKELFQEIVSRGFTVVARSKLFLISQSKQSSDAYSNLTQDLASIDAWKQYLILELEAIAKVKESIRNKLYESDEDRWRKKRDLEDLDAESRRILTVSLAAERANKLAESSSTVALRTDGVITPSEHWIDLFNEQARKPYEDWRRELLARALAHELLNPGTVTPRLLWTIGTLEKAKFDAFAAILDVSSQQDEKGLFFVPGNCLEVSVSTRASDTPVVLGRLVFELADSGLVASTSALMTVKAGETIEVWYRDQRFEVKANEELEIQGLFPSALGESLALFYEPKFSEIGKQILLDWIQSLDITACEITGPLSDAQSNQ